MRALYEIDQDILDIVDMETGEILDIERLSELQMERSAKIEGVACYIKNLENEALGLKAQKDAFAEREKAAKNKIDGLKRWLVEACGGEKFASERCLVSFRRSEQVQVEDVDRLPEEFLRTKTTIEPDKDAIKKAIKAGAVIAGCELVANVSASVK
jgi:hypothetical protein